MATRRGPGDPVDPFASLPLGQTLSGERERDREAARRALDAAVLGRPTPPVVSEQAIRTAETLAALRETTVEAERSADLAAMQRQLAEHAEQARQRALRDVREREQRQAAERSTRLAQARQEHARLEAERREQARQAEQVRRDNAAYHEARERARQPDLDDAPDATILTAIEIRLQRKVEAVQRALNTLTDDLADVRQMLAKKAPAPTGNEEAPFREGERHLDLGGNK